MPKYRLCEDGVGMAAVLSHRLPAGFRCGAGAQGSREGLSQPCHLCHGENSPLCPWRASPHRPGLGAAVAAVMDGTAPGCSERSQQSRACCTFGVPQTHTGSRAQRGQGLAEAQHISGVSRAAEL